MIDKNKKLNIPREEKLFIQPTVREKLFLDLINEYEKRYPGMTLEYAYLNSNPEIPMDYILLFKTRNTDNTVNLIVYDCPMLFSDRSITGYRFCKREGKLDDFFEEAIASMVRFPEIAFKEFIEEIVGLDYFNEESQNYWKNEEFTERVSNNIMALAIRYVPRNINTPK